MGGRRGRGRRGSSSSSRGVGSNPADRSYYTSGRNTSSQNNNRTGQNNQNTGIRVTKKTQKEIDESNEGSYLNTVIAGTGETYKERRNREAHEAFKASQERQEQLQRAINLVDTKKDNQGNVNIDNLTDQQLEDIAKTGLFAMEASGDLGGTFGAEIEANKAKLRFQQTGDATELKRLGYDPGVINSMDPYITDPNNPNEVLRDENGNPIPNPNFDSSLAYDPTGTLSFGDVESNPNLKFSYYGLQNKNASADQIRQFLPNVYGYSATRPGGIGGFGGGYGYGYGGGSGGGGGYGLNMGMGMQGQPRQRGQVGPGDLQERVNQAFLSGGQQSRARGGIIS